MERCLFFGFGLETEVEDDAGIAAGLVSDLRECTMFWLNRVGSGTPMLFEEA
jgi:hypothetical protein